MRTLVLIFCFASVVTGSDCGHNKPASESLVAAQQGPVEVAPASKPGPTPDHFDCSTLCRSAILKTGYSYGLDAMMFMTAYNEGNEKDQATACSAIKDADDLLNTIRQYPMFAPATFASLTELGRVRKICSAKGMLH